MSVSRKRLRASPAAAEKCSAANVVHSALDPDTARETSATYTGSSILQLAPRSKKLASTGGCKIQLHKQVSSTYIQQTRSNKPQINLKKSIKFHNSKPNGEIKLAKGQVRAASSDERLGSGRPGPGSMERAPKPARAAGRQARAGAGTAPGSGGGLLLLQARALLLLLDAYRLQTARRPDGRRAELLLLQVRVDGRWAELDGGPGEAGPGGHALLPPGL